MGVFFRYGRFPLDNRCIVHHRNASTELSALARWGIFRGDERLFDRAEGREREGDKSTEREMAGEQEREGPFASSEMSREPIGKREKREGRERYVFVCCVDAENLISIIVAVTVAAPAEATVRPHLSPS